jgi:SAM-dependent methyltransferase
MKMPLLDVGAREGTLLGYLKEHGFRDLTGLDIWKPGLEEMRKAGHKTIEANIQEYKSDRKYYTVVLSHVLEHCPDPVRVLKNINSMLRKFGVVFIEVPRQEDLRIEQAGHYCNFEDTDDLLEVITPPWITIFLGMCRRRIYYIGQKCPEKHANIGKKL